MRLRYRSSEFHASIPQIETALTLLSLAHPRPPRYRPSGFPSRQASPPTRRRPRRLHFLRRLYKDTREHPESHLRGRGQHVRFPNAEPVEGDEAQSKPAGGIRRRPEGREEILKGEIVKRDQLSVRRRNVALACM